jgi:RHS repeat-associated protein
MMRRYLLSVLVALLSSVCARPQATGLPPFGSLDRVGLETRNNQDLNILLAIPVMSSPGRNGLDLNFSVVYNSSIWTKSGSAWTLNNSYVPPWGWSTTYSTGSTNFKTRTSQTRCNRCLVGDGCLYTDTTISNGYTYTDPMGTVHPFNVYWEDQYNQCTSTETISGTFTGYATDNSGYYITIDSGSGAITSLLANNGFQIGTGSITDRNGNYISSSVNGPETDWTDSAGRLALKVITGTSSIQYKFLDPSGAYQTTTLNLQNLNVKTNFGCAGVTEYTGTASVPQSLILPNGQQYSFTYESYVQNSTTYYTGRLQRVTFPTIGYHEFDYTGANDGINCADGTTLSMNKVVSDGTNTATWNYVRNTTNLTTTITTPKLADTPNANDMVVTFNSSGQEIQRYICSASPCTTPWLRNILTYWATNGTPSSTQTVLEDNVTQSEVDTTYDSNGLLDSVTEKNFGAGSPGAAFRTTTFTYNTSTNYTNLNILNLVTSKQIKDGSGIVQYRQDTAYDATSGDNQSCPTGIAQHNDSAYGCTFYYRGNPTSVTTYLTPGTPAGGITKNFTYDFFGNLLTAQLNCCQNKTWGYSSASSTQNYSLPDSVTSGSSPSLKTTFAYYLPTGQVNTATDQNSLVTTFSYDYLRRATQVSQANGPSASASYDDTHFTSTTTTTIDSTKSAQQITAVDSLGRPNLSTTEDVSNNVISKVSAQYDLAGRGYQTSNPYTGSSPSYWTTTAFDVLGRPTSVTLPDNSATTYTYTTNTVIVHDPTGVQRKSQSDAAGRLSIVWEPDPANNNTLTLQTTNTYSVLDELTQVAQGSSQTRTFLYDALGRILSSTTPESGRVCFGSVSGSTCNTDGYDNFDNLLKRTDARGVLTSYVYDTLNRLTSASYNVSGATGVPSTPTVNLTYGNDSSCNSAHGAGCIGQLITMTDGVGSENYIYNSLEQLTQLQKVINGSTYTTSYAYNLASELTQITYPSTHVVQQSVDAIGRLCEIAPSTTGCGTASSPYATGFGFNTASQVTGFKYGNGLYASFGFSSDRLQLNCLDYSTTNRGTNCTHDSTTKFGLTYSYGSTGSNNGLISGITDTVDSGRTAAYTYDSLYRLTRAVTTGSSGYPAWGLSETYDRYGNRSAQGVYSGCTGITCPTNSVTPDTATNRISGDCYDLSGNLLAESAPPCPSPTYTYDAENRLVNYMSSNPTYVYDGKGLRVKKCAPNCTSPTTYTVYIFSGSKVIAEYDNGAGSPSREYVYSGAALLAKIDSSGTQYYHQDHLSNRMITDSNGNTVAQQGHFPYGEQWYPVPPASPATKWEFTTYERDSESGNDYAQARYNVSRLGRFSSPDPVAGSTADPQSLNRYSYVRNMPVILSDPSGLHPCNTVENRTLDPSSSDSDRTGGPSGFDFSADPATPQGTACGGGSAPCEYTLAGCGGGLGGPGGNGLDGGYVGDDSGLGGAPLGGGIGGFWQYTFSGSANFHWGDYTLDELLAFADEGEISLTGVSFFGGDFSMSGGDPGDPSGADKGKCLPKVGKFVKEHLADAQALASEMGNGVTTQEVLATAGNETGWGGGFAIYGNYFGIHGSGPAGTYYTTENHTPVAKFPVSNGFLLSGQVFVNNITPSLSPGMGNNPLQFFTILNNHGYATGNSGYPAFMVQKGQKRGPYTLVGDCL